MTKCLFVRWFLFISAILTMTSTSVLAEDDTIPQLNIHGFGHAQYDFQNTDGNGSQNHFTNGGLDLFLTAQIAKKISFLNETIFEFGEGGANILDVERVLIKFELKDWFNVAIGRGHTALGYWNQRFHHGAWLPTTANRPLMYSFEDDGGIMPVHYVGLEFSGNFKAPLGKLFYIANVANGRGRIPDAVQLIEDVNDSKAFSFMLTWEPISGLGIGGNVYYDRIPGDPNKIGRAGRIDELISGAHAYWTNDPFEFIAEGTYIHHNDKSSNTIFKHYGAFAQVAYRIKKFKPYYRFDLMSIGEGDPFFNEFDENDVLLGVLPGVEDTTMHTVGLRYDVTNFFTIKGEYNRMNADSADINAGVVQGSFAF